MKAHVSVLESPSRSMVSVNGCGRRSPQLAIPGARPGLHARPDAIFGVGCPWKTFIILASFCQMRSRWPDDVMGAALVGGGP